MATTALAQFRPDKATLIAFGCSIALLLVGAIAQPSFLSIDYLVQQLQIASFLGIVATGMMLVILLGHIDLSIPWTIGIGGMMATAATGFFGAGADWFAIPFGILCGMAVGLVNGFGVAYLRAPSMIFTLGVNAVAQGLMVYHTGGFAPCRSSLTRNARTSVGTGSRVGASSPLSFSKMLDTCPLIRASRSALLSSRLAPATSCFTRCWTSVGSATTGSQSPWTRRLAASPPR